MEALNDPGDPTTSPPTRVPDQLPAFLTVEEAADVLRIGRTTAYGLTREWRATGGASGLPVVNVGHKLRVPLRQLELLAGGPLVPSSATGRAVAVHRSAAPADTAVETTPSPMTDGRVDASGPAPHPPARSPSTRRARATDPADQPSLFDQAS